MRRADTTTRVIMVAIVLCSLAAPAWAYIDPGTASVVWAVGLAPLFGFLAWLGRRFIRLFVRHRPDEEGAEAAEEQDAQATAGASKPE